MGTWWYPKLGEEQPQMCWAEGKDRQWAGPHLCGGTAKPVTLGSTPQAPPQSTPLGWAPPAGGHSLPLEGSKWLAELF